MRLFELSEFTPDEIARAKFYVRSAIKGLLRVKLKTMVDDQFERLASHRIAGDDTLHFTIELETLGNDFLAALGCARNEIIKDARRKK